MIPKWVASMLLLWVALTPSRGHALEDYAAAIADELDLNRKPHCSFCHALNEDFGATDTPFGDALKASGFAVRFGPSSLLRALRALDERGIDTDGDGVGDVDELRAGANPNDPSDAGMPPQEGCAVGVQQGRWPSWPSWPLAAVLLLHMRRRSVSRTFRGRSSPTRTVTTSCFANRMICRLRAFCRRGRRRGVGAGGEAST